MANVTTQERKRTALTLKADDGTVAVVRRDDSIRVAGLPTRLRMYRAEILPVGKTSSVVTLSRPLLKQLLKGGAKISGRVA